MLTCSRIRSKTAFGRDAHGRDRALIPSCRVRAASLRNHSFARSTKIKILRFSNYGNAIAFRTFVRVSEELLSGHEPKLHALLSESQCPRLMRSRQEYKAPLAMSGYAGGFNGSTQHQLEVYFRRV